MSENHIHISAIFTCHLETLSETAKTGPKYVLYVCEQNITK